MLSNNDILKKLRVAHKLRNDDIIKILKLVDFEISKGALGDLFRNSDHPNYVEAGDQILRNFLDALIIHLRGPRPKSGEPVKKSEVPGTQEKPAEQKNPKEGNPSNKKKLSFKDLRREK